MLNKPKFLSPSVNMYGNTVIDLNSDTLPFSCIVDGNEMITDFQIVVSRLSDNVVVFDTGMKTLDKPFFPINNRNQNVVFSIDLKDYFTQILDGEKKPIVLNTSSEYDENKAYYKYDAETKNYTKYEYTASTSWDNDYSSLYVVEFINSVDAYYWAISFKNSKSDTKINSVAEVFYANSIPDTTIYYSYNDEFTDLADNFPKAELTYDPKNNYFRIGDNGEFVKYQYIDETNWETDYTSLYYVNYSGLQQRKIYFKSTYEQNEGILLKRYGWRLTDATNNVVVMDTITQNQIYGVAENISCVCNGLVNETKYTLELYIETQNGYFAVLQTIEFDVNYTVKIIDADLEVVALNNTAGIMLNWGNLRTTEGVVVGGNVNYTENFPVQSSASIEIPKNTSVVFAGTSNSKDLSIDEKSYVVLSFQFDKTQSTTLFEMSGTDEYSNYIKRKLEYSALDKSLEYTIIKGGIVASYKKTLSETIGELCWHIITLYPLIDNSAYYELVESISENCLFPSDGDEALYPIAEDDTEEEPLYPDFGTWNKLRDEVN